MIFLSIFTQYGYNLTMRIKARSSQLYKANRAAIFSRIKIKKIAFIFIIISGKINLISINTLIETRKRNITNHGVSVYVTDTGRAHQMHGSKTNQNGT